MFICLEINKKKRKTIKFNILVGIVPLYLTVEILYSRFKSEIISKSNFNLMFTFFCICAALNIFLWMFSFLSKLNIVKIRWYFFAYINVIGGWIFSILI